MQSGYVHQDGSLKKKNTCNVNIRPYIYKCGDFWQDAFYANKYSPFFPEHLLCGDLITLKQLLHHKWI